MESIQNLINELVNDYTQSKYEERYLKEKIREILEFMLPNIYAVIKDKDEKELVELWKAVKENEEIENLFKELVEKIDRPIIIYVASKFENNKYFGTKIIGQALKLEE